jgi:DNA (cytosine-5)-methyltransferase 1
LAYHYLKASNNIDTYFDYLQGNIDREELYKQVPSEIIESVLNCEITQNGIPDIFQNIIRSLNKSDRDNIDIIVGGPPCQAYSVLGRAAFKNKAKNKNKIEDDPHNYLYKLYAKFLIEYRPKLFIFENVPGLYTANEGGYYKNLKTYFKRIGYKVEDKLLDAADFGVMQRRKRVFIIGWRKDFNFEYPNFETTKNVWSVKHLLDDLPSIRPGEVTRIFKYKKGSNEYLNRFEIRNSVDFVTQHISRPHNDEDLRIYKLAIRLWNKKGIRLKYNEVPGKIRTQQNVTAFLDRFKVVAKDELSHTMIAHIAKDGHHYIHPDIKQLRSLSLREAARIQSFPDDFFFEGSRTSVFRQIGNAVPPLMAEKIAEKLKYLLIKGSR